MPSGPAEELPEEAIDSSIAWRSGGGGDKEEGMVFS